MTATPALSDPEMARLQQVLEDVRFLLERGYGQAALAAARAALARNEQAKR
jgi:ribulose bisphosphate carboxylase small subunit